MSDIDINMVISADQWENRNDLIEHYPKQNRGWKLWVPKKRWYHRLSRTGPRMKFEWKEGSEELVWVRLQMFTVTPPEDTE